MVYLIFLPVQFLFLKAIRIQLSVIQPFWTELSQDIFKNTWENEWNDIYIILTMNSTLYISLDIGGSLSKVCLVAESLVISSSSHSNCLWKIVKLREKNLNLNARTFDSIEECLHFLRESVKQYKKIMIGMTGGGTIKY